MFPICSESQFLLTTPAFDVPIKGVPSEYCHNVWYVRRNKNGVAIYPMVKKMKICLFVLTELTNVTDRQTDRQTHKQTDTA